MKIKILLASALATSSMMTTAAPQPAAPASLAERNETLSERDERMEWFRDARFGMFIHWGLYAVPAGIWNGKPTKTNNCAEWLMLAGRVPIADYAARASEFNPVKYDADAWVKAAKAAGMKYIIITSKHHEGFAMFKSDASDYNMVDATPYKKDPLKDLAKACKKHDMKLGLYYSQNLDWYHPGGGGGEWDPAHQGDPEEYVNNIVIPQLREILSNYGEISVLWFDIPGGAINKSRADRIMETVLDCNPNIIINNRLGGGYRGDIETPEQHVPPMGFPGKDWETCMTMNRSWGYASDDENWKTTRVLLHNLCDITSKGGNYLLNVGPTDRGEIPSPSLERLAEIGEWMETNGQAIHGTRASILSQLPEWGRLTTRMHPDGSATLYAIVFDPPADGIIHLPGLMNIPAGTKVLGSSTRARAQSNGHSMVIEIPASHRNKQDFVVAIRLKDAPRIDDSARADRSGTFTLIPRQAKTTKTLVLEGASGSAGLHGAPEEHLGYWTDPSSTATWKLTSTSKGKFDVYARIAAPAESEGSVIEFKANGQSLTLTITPTGSWKMFTEAKVGTLRLPAGETEIMVRAKTVNGEAPCNLGQIRLDPVK